ncbi:hypothetical protein GOP47_0012041 [Adiantum capillus-veneris]|uniref:Uncharacterized protein n=1 Tax=Adiantum capillus-veneris TaxID=13818 RepID=A0A9D4UV21_ADICA|nr:hypothetical protein GOP47_0012041 [Adiantum capillus-veneris]
MEEQQELWGSSTSRRSDSSSSTPYESAACTPRSSTDRAISCFLSTSTPTYPAKVTLNIESSTTDMGFMDASSIAHFEEPAFDDFDFSARFSEVDQQWFSAPMSSADELFCNGQIRPLWYTSEDYAHLYSARLEHSVDIGGDDDDDSHFDFRSSADYKFTMLSLRQYPTSAVSELPQHVGYGYSRQYDDQNRAWGQGITDDAIEKRHGVQETAESLPRQTSMPQYVDGVGKHAMKVKGEECRGRRTGVSSIRRTRSLSPLRVFHIDDELPRQSVEDNQTLELTKEGSGSAEHEEKWEGDEMARRKGVRLTLKELLHASEQADQGVVHERQARLGSKQQRKAHMEAKFHENSAFQPKFSPKHGSEDGMKGANHVQGARSPRVPHYSSPRVHSEHMRQQTFLPYRHGLLACLGFTSKRYRHVVGIRSMHSKSQGMR